MLVIGPEQTAEYSLDRQGSSAAASAAWCWSMANRLLMSPWLTIGVSFVAWMALNTWLNELLKSVPMSEMIFFNVGPSVFGQGCCARASIALPNRSAVSVGGSGPPLATLVMLSSTLISSLYSW